MIKRNVSRTIGGAVSAVPSKRMWRFGEPPVSTPSGPTPYPLSFSALGLTADGYVYDGAVSRMWTTDAMLTECSSSGSDPVGAWEDLSGNDNHATQATSTRRPLYYSNGTIKSARAGTSGGNHRYLDNPNISDVTKMSYYMVYKVNAGGGGDGYIVIHAGAVWPSGVNAGWATGPNSRIFDGAAQSSLSSGPGTSAGVVRVLKTGTGANALAHATNNTISFTGMNTGAMTSSTSTSVGTGAILGANTTSQQVESCFIFVANNTLTAGQQSTIESYILSTFAGVWS